MQEFTRQLPFIVAFLIAILFIQMMMGEKVTNYLLVLVLAGMVVKNSDKVTKLMNGVTSL
ncbi:hypothetical protein D3D03_16375 [Exiguobacterium sp. RIT452]|uniref:hypothetical protein n=1 Tax=Exiguobacterium sp. RIT452 TaxID=2315552 RepID=UPI000E766202|nr:hypothetical protein [Exiguobacterium sp. RIT452]RJO94692.1 hypothetical protein D3D03_16375 [Exiguobacterium sp. RIT452]